MGGGARLEDHQAHDHRNGGGTRVEVGAGLRGNEYGRGAEGEVVVRMNKRGRRFMEES